MWPLQMEEKLFWAYSGLQLYPGFILYDSFQHVDPLTWVRQAVDRRVMRGMLIWRGHSVRKPSCGSALQGHGSLTDERASENVGKATKSTPPLPSAHGLLRVTKKRMQVGDWKAGSSHERVDHVAPEIASPRPGHWEEVSGVYLSHGTCRPALILHTTRLACVQHGEKERV